MCGISGEFSFGAGAAPIDIEALIRVRDAMHLRGPDGVGLWTSADGHVGLAHRRLSIIDLAARSDQPLLRADGSAALVFNGEIYNYRALRQQLLEQGAVLKTEGDSEVVLELLAREGIAGLRKLRGMYALGFYALSTRTLILARDPYGIKPLYYADRGGLISFASSVKALAAHGEISRARDPAAEVSFLMFGSVAEPLTWLSAVRALPPGGALSICAGTGRQQATIFQSLSEIFSLAPQQTSAEALQAALLDSVKHHLEADVPVGAFLSAGVDSGALLGLMRDAGAHDIQTLTVRFREFAGLDVDEGVLAAQVAQHYQASHHEHWVSEADFTGDFSAFMQAMDQPSIDGMNSWMVSRATRALGLKVAMSGLGGDELLGGYSSFQDIPRWQRRFGGLARLPGTSTVARWLTPMANALGLHPKAPGMLEFAGSLAGLYLLRRGLFLPSELSQFMDKERLQFGSARLAEQTAQAWAIPENMLKNRGDSFAQVAYLEATRYMRNQLLRDTDWASMAHSLEVRVPLVDVALLSQFMPANATVQRLGGKKILGTAPKLALLDAVINRPKTGFTTPVPRWQQSMAELQGWRRYPSLQKPNTPWARRYAVALLAGFGAQG
jgi:asparagine synthase (glutamine-hydrolysing)